MPDLHDNSALQFNRHQAKAFSTLQMQLPSIIQRPAPPVLEVCLSALQQHLHDVSAGLRREPHRDARIRSGPRLRRAYEPTGWPPGAVRRRCADGDVAWTQKDTGIALGPAFGRVWGWPAAVTRVSSPLAARRRMLLLILGCLRTSS